MRDPRTKRRRSKSPVPRNTGPPEGTEGRQTTASGANTPVSVKVKRLEAEIVKKARSMIVPKTSTRMIQPTLASFLGVRSGLEGQERGGRKTVTSPTRPGREGQGACQGTSTSPGHGEGRARPLMRGSPEHLLLHEAKALVKDRGKPRQARGKVEAETWSHRRGRRSPGGSGEKGKETDLGEGRVQGGRNTTSGPSVEREGGEKTRVPRDK